MDILFGLNIIFSDYIFVHRIISKQELLNKRQLFENLKVRVNLNIIRE